MDTPSESEDSSSDSSQSPTSPTTFTMFPQPVARVRGKRTLSQMSQSEGGWQKSLSQFAKSVTSTESDITTTTATTTRRGEWNPRICDVRFRVKCELSNDDCEVASVKSLLAIHSDVFAAMFFGTGDFKSMSEDSLDGSDCVQITDCSKEAMDTINAFVLHCFEKAALTPANIGEVLYAATKYCVEGLKDACHQYIREMANIPNPNALTYMYAPQSVVEAPVFVKMVLSLDKWHMKDAAVATVNSVCQNQSDFKAIIGCESAAKLLPKWAMVALLKGNAGFCKESPEAMFTFAVEWATAKQRTEIEATESSDLDSSADTCKSAETMSQTLQPFLEDFAFNRMGAKFFSDEVCAIDGLLSETEQLKILRSLVSKSE